MIIIWTPDILFLFFFPLWHISDDVITWKRFPRYMPFVRGIHRLPAVYPHKGPVARTSYVSFDVSLNKLLYKQHSGWWFQTPRGSCDVIVMERVIFKTGIFLIVFFQFRSRCGVGRTVDYRFITTWFFYIYTARLNHSVTMKSIQNRLFENIPS